MMYESEFASLAVDANTQAIAVMLNRAREHSARQLSQVLVDDIQMHMAT